MRVRRETVMAMHFDAMVPLARFFLGIDMNNDERKIFEMVQQLVPDFLCNRVGIAKRKL